MGLRNHEEVERQTKAKEGPLWLFSMGRERMILSEREITEAWEKGEITFTPEIQRRQIRYSSVDLHLGYIITFPVERRDIVVDLTEEFKPGDISYEREYQDGDYLILEPNEFINAQTLEYITMPNYLAARVEGRSRYARFGLTVHNTAAHIHPEWKGRLTLEIINHGRARALLYPGRILICQIIFHRLSQPLEMGYGTRETDRWQNQKRPWSTREQGSK